MLDKLIIEARVNEFAMRVKNQHVPWTPEEIGRDAEELRRGGSSILHFHARRPDGAPAHDTATYAGILDATRTTSDLVVHPTLGQITLAEIARRIARILAMAADPALTPELGSIDLGSTNIDVLDPTPRQFRSGERVYSNSIDTLLLFLRRFRAAGARPALAAWSMPLLRTLAAFIDMDAVQEPAWLLLLHTEGGIVGGHPATAAGMRAFRDALQAGRRMAWSVCCKEGSAAGCDGDPRRWACRDRHRRLCLSGARVSDERRNRGRGGTHGACLRARGRHPRRGAGHTGIARGTGVGTEGGANDA